MKKLAWIELAIGLLCTACLALAADDDNNNAPPSIKKDSGKEPPFPLLTDPGSVSLGRIHITSESVSDGFGYQTIEEYTDFDLGKSALMETDKTGTKVTFLDAQADIAYQYEPYICQIIPNFMIDTLETNRLGLSAIWKKIVKVKDESSRDATKKMYLYGVAALWLNAANIEKTYSKSEFVYSASRDIHQLSHKWTLKDESANQLVHLHFFLDEASKASLEMIQIQSMETKAVLRTVNILAVDNIIPSQIYDSVLQVPVGFGCACELASTKALVKFPELNSLYLSGPLLSHSHMLELEVTATKFAADSSLDSNSAQSDTVSIDMVHANMGAKFTGIFQMVKMRSSTQNTKTIIDHTLKVKQLIDMRTGVCQMTNMMSTIDEGGMYSEELHAFHIKFSNGLKLALSPKAVQILFVDQDDFHFIKSVRRNEREPSYLYFEQSESALLPGKQARIVRVYSSRDGNQDIQLESVTVWVFDDAKQSLRESYHINVMAAKDLEDKLPELAKLFDVSEECYLNNEDMKVNRDYAWIEVFYPLTSIQSNLLSTMEYRIKYMLYAGFLMRSSVAPTRIPRMELMFEETGLIVRMLLLDMPPLELSYDLIVGSTVKADTSKGELEELAVDLRHCADYCRLHLCNTMSFCAELHTCSISPLSYESRANNDLHLVRDSKCQTFVMPNSGLGLLSGALLDLSLHKIVSTMQHTDYQAIEAPQMPDELVYPISETGIDELKRQEIARIYNSQMLKFVLSKFLICPALILMVTAENYPAFVLLPDRVQLEQDPLDQFGLAGDQDLDQEDSSGTGSMGIGTQTSTSAFREGVNFKRFKISALIDSQSDPSDEKPRNLVQPYFGLSYDQCALACIDGKCSSFSYCSHREECILTNIYNLAALDDSAMEKDIGCFIAQRDFVSKFNRFPEVYRPQLYKASALAVNPSECAHTCMARTDFNCLAFEYCPTGRDIEKPMCFYHENRNLPAKKVPAQTEASTGTDASSGPAKTATSKIATSCDHYSRSYLADFVRIEYREIDESVLNELRTSQLTGLSVDRCAEFCAIELIDCSAFQFCFDYNQEHKTMQRCDMIVGKPKGAQAADLEVVIGGDGRVVRAGKLFKTNQNCHVFSLRPDSSEAHLRELALSSLTTRELDAREKAESGKSSGGLSIFGAILLYLSMTLVFAVIGCGVLLAKQHNRFVAAKFERVRILLGGRV